MSTVRSSRRWWRAAASTPVGRPRARGGSLRAGPRPVARAAVRRARGVGGRAPRGQPGSNELRLAVVEDLLQARLDTGDHRGVAAGATVAAGEEPFRERRWEILALAQYRGGRQADALASIRTARRMLGNELGLDPGSDLVVLERSILSQDPSLAGERDLLVPSARVPLEGPVVVRRRGPGRVLRALGRDRRRLWQRLERHPLLVLTGPSGSGKSSLMLAGLAPALVRRGLAVVAFTPGVDPAVAMSTARLGVPGDPILLIDQFEETFTLAGPASDPAAWLAELASYAESRSPVAVTLRADQMAHLTRVPGLRPDGGAGRPAGRTAPGAGPAGGHRGAGAPRGVAPGARPGRPVDPGHRGTTRRSAPPSHALVETWQRRDRGLLTVEGYVDSGGLRGAVAASADRLYESLSDAERVQLRRVMLRMVSLSDAGEPVRSSLPASAVADDPARLPDPGPLGPRPAGHHGPAVVRAGARGARPGLAPAAVLARRERARSNSSSATSRRRPTGWDALGRPDSELYRGARLQSATEWLARDDADPTPLEREFLATSQARADDARLATERQIRHERRQNRRLRVLLAGVAALLLVAAGIGAVALDRGRDAARDRDLAEQASEAAAHEALVGRSLTLRSTNRSVAALLAVQAFRPDRTTCPSRRSSPPSPRPRGSSAIGTSRATTGSTPQGSRAPRAPSSPGTSGHLGLLSITTGTLTHPFGAPLPRRLDYSVLRVSKDGEPGGPAALHAARPRPVRQPRVARATATAGAAPAWWSTTSRRANGCSVRSRCRSAAGTWPSATTGTWWRSRAGTTGTWRPTTSPPVARLGRLAGLPRPAASSCGGTPPPWPSTPPATSTWARWPGPSARSTRGRSRCSGPSRRRGCPPTWVSWSRSRTPRRAGTTCSSPPATRPCSPSTSRRAVGAGSRTCVAELFSRAVSVLRRRSRGTPRIYCGNHFGQVEERDLATGQQTGLRLDPQLGSVGDLVAVRAPRISWGSPPVRRRTPAGGSTARTWSRGCASEDGRGTHRLRPVGVLPRGGGACTQTWPDDGTGVARRRSRSPPTS